MSPEGKPTVLLVDDVASFRETLDLELTPLGAEGPCEVRLPFDPAQARAFADALTAQLEEKRSQRIKAAAEAEALWEQREAALTAQLVLGAVLLVGGGRTGNRKSLGRRERMPIWLDP